MVFVFFASGRHICQSVVTNTHPVSLTTGYSIGLLGSTFTLISLDKVGYNFYPVDE